MKIIVSLAAAAAFAIPGAVAAQEAPAITMQPEEAGAVTDEEVAEFASIILQGREFENAGMDEAEKERAMLDLIRESEMGLGRFGSVAQALRQDAALQERVQNAVIQQLAADIAD